VNINNPDADAAKGLYAARARTIGQMVAAGVLVGGIKGRLPSTAFAITIEGALRMGRYQGINIRKFVTDNREKFRA